MSPARKQRTMTAAAVTVCLLVLGGIAFAFWKATGSGSATAASTTVETLVLSPGTPAADLYPGGATAVVVSVVNTGPAEARVGSLALAVSEADNGFGTDAEHSDCSVGSLSFVTQTNEGVGWKVPAAGNLTITLPGSLSMATDAGDDCQGATFSVHLRVLG